MIFCNLRRHLGIDCAHLWNIFSGTRFLYHLSSSPSCLCLGNFLFPVCLCLGFCSLASLCSRFVFRCFGSNCSLLRLSLVSRGDTCLCFLVSLNRLSLSLLLLGFCFLALE